MRQVRTKRLALIASLAFALAGGLAAWFFAAEGTYADSQSAFARLGWLVPLVAGILIGAITLVLLGGRSSDEREDETPVATSECAACGGSILTDWRMCPHCGALLECDTQLPLSSPDFHNI